MASSSKPTVLWVGRLSGPKNDVLLNVLHHVAPKVLQQIPGVRFQVVGGPVTETHRQLEKEFPHIHFEGHQKNLKPYYQKAAVVVGAGRVALEAMSLKRPVLAIGERKYIGPLLPGNIEEAKATNFGDCWDREDFDWSQMSRDLVELIRNKIFLKKAVDTGYSLARTEYDQKTLYPKLGALYQKVLLEKNISGLH